MLKLNASEEVSMLCREVLPDFGAPVRKTSTLLPNPSNRGIKDFHLRGSVYLDITMIGDLVYLAENQFIFEFYLTESRRNKRGLRAKNF